MANLSGVRVFAGALFASSSFITLASPALAQDSDEQKENVIVVSGIRASLENAVSQKEGSDQIKDVVSAEDIGKLPDTNVAEALQRITGVQINRDLGEGSEIAVRGFSQNRIEVNGQTQVGSTADGNVSFNSIPSDAFKSIEVIKTPAADEVEGALGAIVRFNTRQPLDNGGKTVLSVSAQAQYSERADSWTPNFNILASKGWNFGDGGEVGLLLGYTRKERKLRQDFFLIRGWEATGGTGLDLDGDGVAGEQVDRDANGVITDLQDGIYVPLQTIFRSQLQSRTLDSWNGAFQLKPSDGFEFYLNGTYSRNRANDLQYQQNARPNSAITPDGLGGFKLAPQYSDVPGMVISPDQTALSAFLGYYNNRGVPQGIGYGISAASNPPQQDIWNIQMGAKIDLSDRLKSQIEATYAHGKRFTRYNNLTSGIGGTDRPFFFYDFTTGNDIPTFVPLASDVNGSRVTGFDDAARYDFSDLAIYQFQNIAVNEDRERNKEFAFRADFDWEIDGSFLTSIEFGTRFAFAEGSRGRDRAKDAPGAADGSLGGVEYVDLDVMEPGSIIAYPFDDFLAGASGDYPNQFLLTDPNYFVTNLQEIFSTYGINFAVDPLFGYTAKRETHAAYVKGNFAFDLGSMPVFGNVGVRYVSTTRRAIGPTPAGVQGAIDIIEEHSKLSYSNWLPSLNLVTEPFDRFYVRFGAARSMARPNLQDISPLLIISDSFDRGRGGNPALLPQTVNQLDLSLEKYWGRSNLLALALFYKHFDERIEDGIVNKCLPVANDGLEQTPGNDGCLVGQDVTRVETPVNVGGATVKGFEASIQQSLDFLPSPLDGFGFIANYTYVDAGYGSLSATGAILPVQDLSKHSYNMIGYYEKYGFEIRAAYTWRSHFYDERTDTNQASFAKAYGQLDMSASYDITKKLSITAEALNLLNRPEESYQELLERPLTYRINDRRFLFGFRWKM